MVIVGKVKRGEKDGNRGCTSVLEGHREKDGENEGAMTMLNDIGTVSYTHLTLPTKRIV